ncbi:MAG: gliding motility-associated C-terminal domain-containing protein [Bacteroidia bacterium]
MKHLYIVFLLALTFPSFSQVNTCFEIESILVDACAPTNQEGLNEMVRFKVGPNPLNANDLSVVWATTANSWDGVCQSNQTSAIVAELNSTIQSCGILLQPQNFILPANSNVLLVSSQQMDPSSNSFAGLSDTLYIIFHCAANATGNFANYNSSGGLRTLSMSFSAPAACSDVVSYDRGNLVTSSGTPGSENGATVNFSPDGTPEYLNFGCVAPFVPLSADWDAPANVCVSSAPIELNDLVTGVIGGSWSGEGVSGSLFNPAGLSGTIEITYSVVLGTCNAEVTESIEIITSGDASWTNPGELCATASAIDLSDFVTGDAGGVFAGDGVTGNTFSPLGLNGSIDITYSVGDGNCIAVQLQSILVTAGPDASWNFPVNTICSETGEIVLDDLVTGTVGGVWSGDGVTGNVFNPLGLEGDVTVVYEVTEGECFSSVSNTVLIIDSPSAAWTLPIFICSSAGEYPLDDLVTGTVGGTWSGDNVTGSTFNSNGESGSFSITYSVGSPGCFDEFNQILVVIPAGPSPAIIGDRRYCEGGELPTLTSSGGENSTWYSDEALTTVVFSGETYQPANDNVTTFYVTSGNEDCQSDPIAVSLDLELRIDLALSVDGSPQICDGQSLTLSAATDGLLSWSTGENSPQITISEAGTYLATSAGFCNSATDSITITDASILVTLEISTSSGPATLVVDVVTTTEGGEDCIYLLNGVETTLSAGNTLSLENEGIYLLTYQCTNSAGCIAEVSRQIDVFSGVVKLDFPNSFTPNGDGFNDNFLAQTSALTELEIVIFNRWGQQVAQFSGLSNSWNGSSNSGDVPDGVYFYIAKALDIYGNDVERQGSVTLIRQ